MKPTSLLSLAALLATSSTWISAETIMNKCTDGIRLTYTDKPCEKLGLKVVGPINNAVTEIITAPDQDKSHGNDKSDPEATPEPTKLKLDKSLNLKNGKDMSHERATKPL